jgi:hypothetical protein
MKRFALAALAALPLGCGGSMTPAGQPGSQDPAVTQASSEPDAPPDLAPVAAPAELFAVGRIKNPAKLVDTFASWSKLPVDWRRMLAEGEPGIERVVYLDAPIDLCAALDPGGSGGMPQPFAVVSVGLTSLAGAVEFARRKGEGTRQIRPGVHRLEGRSPSCAIAASVGKAPARMVCGDRAEDVDALLGYVTRGLPNEQLGSGDLHFELRVEPIRKRHQREIRQLKLLAPFAVRDLSIDNPRFDRALKEAAHGLAEELVLLIDDVDRLTGDVWVKEDTGLIESQWKLAFQSSESWAAQTFGEISARAMPAPESYWKLPADAGSASFSVGSDPKRGEKIRRTLAELLDGWLEHEKVPRRVRDSLVALVEELWKTDAGSVYASGALPPDPQAATETKRARDEVRRMIGWHLFGIADKPEPFKKYLGNVVRAYNDPQLRQTLQKRLDLDAKDLPKLSTRPARGLPAGSVVYELSIVLDETDKKPLSVLLVVVPRGQTTWFGLAADEKALVQKLDGVLKGSADGSLAGRPGLGTLKTGRFVSGGFFSLLGLHGSMQWSLLEKRGMGSGFDAERVLASMPHGGKTPMTYQVAVDKQGKGLTIDWRFQVPRAVVEDLAAAVPAIAASAIGIRLQP